MLPEKRKNVKPKFRDMKVTIREKELKDGRFSLYLDIYFEGERDYKTLGLYITKKRKDSKADNDTVELAEKIKIKIERELLNDKYKFSGNSKINIIEYVEQLLTEKNYYHWPGFYRYLKIWLNGNSLRIVKITKEMLLEFQNLLLSNVSNNTAFDYMSCFRYTLNKAAIDDIIPFSPYTKIPKDKRLKKIKPEIEWLSTDDLEVLVNTPLRKLSPDMRHIILFSCFSGLRWGDVSRLKWSEVVNLNGTEVLNFEQRKINERTYIPLSGQCKQILEARRLLNEGETESIYVFPNMYAEHNRESNKICGKVNYRLKQWVEKAGIDKNIHFHCTRHTFAVMLLEHGEDIFTVQKLLGHKNVITTERYLHLVDELKIDAVQNLPKLRQAS